MPVIGRVECCICSMEDKTVASFVLLVWLDPGMELPAPPRVVWPPKIDRWLRCLSDAWTGRAQRGPSVGLPEDMPAKD